MRVTPKKSRVCYPTEKRWRLLTARLSQQTSTRNDYSELQWLIIHPASTQQMHPFSCTSFKAGGSSDFMWWFTAGSSKQNQVDLSIPKLDLFAIGRGSLGFVKSLNDPVPPVFSSSLRAIILISIQTFIHSFRHCLLFAATKTVTRTTLAAPICWVPAMGRSGF